MTLLETASFAPLGFWSPVLVDLYMVQEQKSPFSTFHLKSTSFVPGPCNWQQKAILTILGAERRRKRDKSWPEVRMGRLDLLKLVLKESRGSFLTFSASSCLLFLSPSHCLPTADVSTAHFLPPLLSCLPVSLSSGRVLVQASSSSQPRERRSTLALQPSGMVLRNGITVSQFQGLVCALCPCGLRPGVWSRHAWDNAGQQCIVAG